MQCTALYSLVHVKICKAHSGLTDYRHYKIQLVSKAVPTMDFDNCRLLPFPETREISQGKTNLFRHSYACTKNSFMGMDFPLFFAFALRFLLCEIKNCKINKQETVVV